FASTCDRNLLLHCNHLSVDCFGGSCASPGMDSAFTEELSPSALVSCDDLRSGERKNNHVWRLRWEHVFERHGGIRWGYLESSHDEHPASSPYCSPNGL